MAETTTMTEQAVQTPPPTLAETEGKKLSELTINDVKTALRIDYTTDDGLLPTLMSAAYAFILDRTGLTRTEADSFPQLCHAYFCICSDMYDVREATVQTDKLNPTVRTILNQVSVPEVLIC